MDTAETPNPTPPASRPVAHSPARPPEKRAAWPSVGIGPHLAAMALIFVTVLLAFVNTLHREKGKGFALDNKFIILEDPRLRSNTKENRELIFRQDYWWPKAVSGLYRPLTTYSYMVNYAIFGNGAEANGYQWVNLLLHWGNAVLVYFMVLVLMGKVWPALLVAAVFSVHPMVTESVTNIVGRADLFALASVLGSFLCYVKSTVVRSWRKIPWLALAALITTVGMFCKESAVVIVGVVFLYDWAYRWTGRCSRLECIFAWVGSIGLNALLLGTIAGLQRSAGNVPLYFSLAGLSIVLLVPTVAANVLMARQTVRRLHDIGYSGAYLLFLTLGLYLLVLLVTSAIMSATAGRFRLLTDLVPVLLVTGGCLFFLAQLFIKRGQSGHNSHGSEAESKPLRAICIEAMRSVWSYCSGYLGLLLPLAFLFWVRAKIFANLRPPELPFVDNPLIGWDFWVARLTAIKVVGKYLWLFLWPRTLSCDYSYNHIPAVSFRFGTWEDWKAIVALVTILVLIVVAIRQYQRNRAVFFFILFFFGTFLPSSNLIPNPTFGKDLRDPVSWCIGSIMAERFMYVPSIGFAGCLVIAIYALCRKVVGKLDVSGWAQRLWLQVTARTVLGVFILLYGVRTFFRNADWEDDERLWTQAVQAAPNSFKTHKSLAFALYEKDSEFKQIDRIIDEGEKAAAVTDKAQIVFLHLGAYYRIKGDLTAQRAADGSLVPSAESRRWYEKSVEALKQAVPLDRAFNEDNRQKELGRGKKAQQIPDIGNHEIYWNLGLSLMRLSRHEEALAAYGWMRHLAPGNADAYLSIASVQVARNQLDDAAVTLLQTLLLDNNRQEALRLLAEIYRQIDREGCAIIQNQPGNPLAQGPPRVNANCAIVQRHICSAYYGLVQVFVEAKQFALAAATKQSALTTYKCAPGPFQQLLP